MNERVTQISLPDSAQAYLLHHLPNKREKMDSLSDLAYKAYQTHTYLQKKNLAMVIKSSTNEYGEENHLRNHHHQNQYLPHLPHQILQQPQLDLSVKKKKVTLITHYL